MRSLVASPYCGFRERQPGRRAWSQTVSASPLDLGRGHVDLIVDRAGLPAWPFGPICALARVPGQGVMHSPLETARALMTTHIAHPIAASGGQLMPEHALGLVGEAASAKGWVGHVETGKWVT